MGSPEFTSESGKSTRSNFSQTCSLLSHYMKENKASFNFGEQLGRLVFSERQDKEVPTRTMDLLPMIEKSGQSDSGADHLYPGNKAGSLIKKSGDQMTIFYGGKVFVFDDLPAERAHQIISLASSAAVSPPKRRAEPLASFPECASARGLYSPHQLLGSDLPIKRKNSLARFLEKRKERVVAAEPYQPRKPAKASEAWLELAPHIQRH